MVLKKLWGKRELRTAILCAGTIALYCFLANALGRNVSPEDKVFGSYGYFRKFSIMLSFPSIFLVRAFTGGANLPNDDLFRLLALNFCTYTALIFGVLRAFTWWKSLPDDPQSIKRRRFIIGAAAGVGAVSGAAYLRKDVDTVEIVNQALPLPYLPSAMQGWKLLLLSDLHRGPYISKEYLDTVVDMCNEQRPDLVCIVGDFVYEDPKFFPDITATLKRLQARVALFGVLGNHDHWQGGFAVARPALEAVGMHLVDNARLYIGADGQISAEPHRDALCVAGVGDSWEDKVDYKAALDGVPNEIPHLVLTHNPDAAEMDGQELYRVDAMLCGHTHGGQISLPVLGTILVPTKHGDKYVAGWAQAPHFPVYINKGIGMTVLPIRCGARPEITVFTLERK